MHIHAVIQSANHEAAAQYSPPEVQIKQQKLKHNDKTQPVHDEQDQKLSRLAQWAQAYCNWTVDKWKENNRWSHQESFEWLYGTMVQKSWAQKHLYF